MNTAVLDRPKRDEGTRARRDSIINVRVPKVVRDLIDTAAEVLGKTRSEFILESARKHAVDVLIDRRLFTLEGDQYDEFLRVLDQPPQPNERLKKLLRSKSPWEK
jgi:uncharacterized protein (DUF1778 family)